jgi:hypothetical protein
MNEKYLWELWAKCKHPHPKHGGGDMVWPMEFAELIVTKCAVIATRCESNGNKNIGAEILKHFGVEE